MLFSYKRLDDTQHAIRLREEVGRYVSAGLLAPHADQYACAKRKIAARERRSAAQLMLSSGTLPCLASLSACPLSHVILNVNQRALNADEMQHLTTDR